MPRGAKPDLLNHPKLFKLAMQSIAMLVSLGVSESRACSGVSRLMLAGSPPTLLKLWRRAKRYVKMPKMRRGKFGCAYCGLGTGIGLYRMIPVCDWRREIVWAHERCEILEQTLAGGL